MPEVLSPVPASPSPASHFARAPENRGAWRIDPTAFAEEMAALWAERGQAVCAEAAWTCLCETLNDAAANSHDGLWRPFPAETGIGKTAGLCLYAAKLIQENHDSVERDRVGMLILARERDAVDLIAADIKRSLPAKGFEKRVAVWYDGAKPDHSALRGADILVICHARYVGALTRLNMGKTEEWNEFSLWRHGERKLVVFDEAPGGLIEENRITARELHAVLSHLPPALSRRFPMQASAIHDALAHLKKKGETSVKTRIAWPRAADCQIGVEKLSMSALRSAAHKLPYDADHGKQSATDRKMTAERMDHILRDLEACLRRWAYFAKAGDELTLNTSRLLTRPKHPIRGAVVLDATAELNPLWGLLAEARVVPVPKVRLYDRGRLHVARVRGLGKTKMRATGKARMPRLIEDLSKRLPADSRVLCITNECAEGAITSLDHPFAALETAHWGAVDGRNDWRDFNVVVILGLQFRDTAGPINQLFATQGVRADVFGRSEVLRNWQCRKLSADIVQAVNRGGCREVIDSEGHCPEVDIFVALPAGRDGDIIETNIKAAMPGIVAKVWAFDPDGPRVTVRANSSHASLILFMKAQPAGEINIREIGKRLGYPKKTAQNLACILRDADHPLSAELAREGWTFTPGRPGRGGWSPYLQKRAGQRRRRKSEPQKTSAAEPEAKKLSRAERQDALDARIVTYLAASCGQRVTRQEMAARFDVSGRSIARALARIRSA